MSVRPWGPKYEAELQEFIRERDRKRAESKRQSDKELSRRAARRQLLETLRRQSAWCYRHHVYVDQFAARELWELCRLARHYRAKSVNYEGIRFRVGYSVWAGTIYDPETGAGLVMFTCSE